MTRQPIHVVYGGAHLFRHDVAAKLGRIALEAFINHRELLGLPAAIERRVIEKLKVDPVEDLRIDFEDGYGYRSDEEEDQHAQAAALEVKRGVASGTLPAFCGIRIKSFALSRARALRTMRVFFENAGVLPPNFCVTLPKVTEAAQVTALCHALEQMDVDVRIELMIETPEGLRNIQALIAAAGERCRGAHFGPYDFTASCGVLSTSQGLRHPLCTHARNQMLVELAGTGIWLSDGPTSTLPTGSKDDIGKAWRTQWDDIQNSLATGFYQGWDLHPAQLPVRYAAVYSYFLDNLPHASARMKNFLAQSAQATRVGSAFDDAATAQGLRNFFLRAAGCGAITGDELVAACGVSLEQLNQLRF
jgi:citrate lyase beta subunit